MYISPADNYLLFQERVRDGKKNMDEANRRLADTMQKAEFNEGLNDLLDELKQLRHLFTKTMDIKTH